MIGHDPAVSLCGLIQAEVDRRLQLALSRPLFVAAALLLAAPVGAGEFVLGLGADDIRDTDGATAFAVELRGDPLWHLGAASLGLGAAAQVDTDGDLWGGAGVYLTAPLGDRWRFEASLMPGAYSQGSSGTDLGTSAPIFRTQVGVSAEIGGGWRAGVAVDHKSNARTASSNPGSETLLVTLGRGFQTASRGSRSCGRSGRPTRDSRRRGTSAPPPCCAARSSPASASPRCPTAP